MLKTRDQFKEAAGVYFLISDEVMHISFTILWETKEFCVLLLMTFPLQDSVHSAVMLEQASYCYLYSKPPMLRKYGFHLVLSGKQYKKSDQVFFIVDNNRINFQYCHINGVPLLNFLD